MIFWGKICRKPWVVPLTMGFSSNDVFPKTQSNEWQYEMKRHSKKSIYLK
jgi:hypothetical protein